MQMLALRPHDVFKAVNTKSMGDDSKGRGFLPNITGRCFAT